MTIIAWDGKTLVADGRIVQGHNIVTDNYNKIIIFNDPVKYFDDALFVMAVSGSIDDVDRMVEHIQREDIGGKEFPTDDFKHGITAIIIGVRYNYILDNNHNSYLTRYDKTCKLAEGTGAYVAITAMFMGKTALQAALIACELVISCGGKMRTMSNKRILSIHKDV